MNESFFGGNIQSRVRKLAKENCEVFTAVWLVQINFGCDCFITKENKWEER